MSLEMKVHKEIAAYEPKPMMGRTWRQLGALVFMIVIGGGAFAGITFVLTRTGQTLESATSVAMYAMFPVVVPAAAWGWWRPMGLMPEAYLQFSLRHILMRKNIPYDDTLRAESSTNGKSIPRDSERPSDRAGQRAERRANAAAVKSRKALTEH